MDFRGVVNFDSERLISDQLKAEEISLIESTHEDAEAAKARLDAHRSKRRERFARKKALSN